MFSRSLKKQQKFHALAALLGDLTGRNCLLVTCGDNNGALNWHFKRLGGTWSWADAERESIQQISELTGDPVAAMDKDAPALPFPDNSFDLVMTIDVHEHLQHPERVNQELYRLVKPGGRVIVTTPNGDETKLAVRIKHLIGMRKEDYGHYVVGYDIPDLQRQLGAVGLKMGRTSSYARFFTEMLELGINFAYVKILSRKSKAKVEKGQIAPLNKNQLKSVEKTYKLYSLLYPFMLVVSQLDHLVGFRRGYAVIVEAQK
jgi:SAM-dependent methyltransferase